MIIDHKGTSLDRTDYDIKRDLASVISASLKIHLNIFQNIKDYDFPGYFWDY
jgi:hypothetical protein